MVKHIFPPYSWVLFLLAAIGLMVLSEFGHYPRPLPAPVSGYHLSAALPPTLEPVRIAIEYDCATACGRLERGQDKPTLPHFVLGLGTLRVAAVRSRIVADDRVHSLKALLKGTEWSRHVRVRPAAGRGVRFAVDVTQVEAAAGTAFCAWLREVHHWDPGPYPCEVAY